MEPIISLSAVSLVAKHCLMESESSLWDEIIKPGFVAKMKQAGADDEAIEAGWQHAIAALDSEGNAKLKKYDKDKGNTVFWDEQKHIDFITGGTQTGDNVKLTTIGGEVRMTFGQMFRFDYFQAKVAEYVSIVYPTTKREKHLSHVGAWIQKLHKITPTDVVNDETETFRVALLDFLAEKQSGKSVSEKSMLDGNCVYSLNGEYIFKESLLRKWIAGDKWTYDWTREKIKETLTEIFGDDFNPAKRVDNKRLYAIKQNNPKVLEDGGGREDNGAGTDI